MKYDSFYASTQQISFSKFHYGNILYSYNSKSNKICYLVPPNLFNSSDSNIKL